MSKISGFVDTFWECVDGIDRSGRGNAGPKTGPGKGLWRQFGDVDGFDEKR